jgi:hypothetical protein
MNRFKLQNIPFVHHIPFLLQEQTITPATGDAAVCLVFAAADAVGGVFVAGAAETFGGVGADVTSEGEGSAGVPARRAAGDRNTHQLSCISIPSIVQR